MNKKFRPSADYMIWLNEVKPGIEVPEKESYRENKKRKISDNIQPLKKCLAE
jgi:hypothetical protein